MKELFDISFSAPNVIASGLLLLIVVYWFTVLLGALDMSFLDFDVDVELDVDVEAEVEVDGGTEGGVTWLNHVLAFFNLGKVPFMVFLSFLAIPIWLGSVTVNNIFGNESFLLSLAFLLPILLVSLFVAKFCTMPFIKLFDMMDEPVTDRDVLGRVGVAKLAISSSGSSQAEVNINGDFMTVYARTKGAAKIEKGEKLLVISQNKEDGYYLVEPYHEVE